MRHSGHVHECILTSLTFDVHGVSLHAGMLAEAGGVGLPSVSTCCLSSTCINGGRAVVVDILVNIMKFLTMK